ncbi:MAG: hypothetical protein ACJASX_002130 [Limisphaerales bacterium]
MGKDEQSRFRIINEMRPNVGKRAFVPIFPKGQAQMFPRPALVLGSEYAMIGHHDHRAVTGCADGVEGQLVSERASAFGIKLESMAKRDRTSTIAIRFGHAVAEVVGLRPGLAAVGRAQNGRAGGVFI